MKFNSLITTTKFLLAAILILSSNWSFSQGNQGNFRGNGMGNPMNYQRGGTVQKKPETPKLVKVELKQINGSYKLYRNGKPYYIKGAGGKSYLDRLAAYGGNSIRTWSLDNAKEVLDEAHKHGITVMLGMWVQHERHGFDYNNEERVAEQLEKFTKAVKELKDHPALLLWAIGNEVNLQYTNKNVWNAVQDIAAMIHKEDPNHPTTTVTAGIDQDLVTQIQTKCQDIDILSVNTYADAPNIPSKVRQFGWKGAYLITEWGPNGHWEVAKTKWGAPFEQTSTEKAQSYKERLQVIMDDTTQCIGSYVFVWGNKQERTPTWYGIFLETGEESQVMDNLILGWSGKLPENQAPSITPIKLNNQQAPASIYLEANEDYTAQVTSKDPDGDNLMYEWVVMEESKSTKSGGDKEAVPATLRNLKMKPKDGNLEFAAPSASGAYRLFVYVYDGQNNVATANVPFYVE